MRYALSPRFMRSSRSVLLGVCGGVATLAAASPASAYLGSFTPADGYQIIQPWVDVSYYNSGQYGANAGGGLAAHVAPDSGLWRVENGFAGGIYSSWASRTAALTSVVGNTYPAVPPAAGGGAQYVVGNHSPGRTDFSALAIRNDTPNNAGPVKYNYTLDTYDFGGAAPASITSGVVSTQFYFQASPTATVGGAGSLPRDKFTMSFKDASSTVGLEWGYAEDNEVYWRAGTSGPRTYTGVYVDVSLWDGVRVDIDLSAETFGIDYYDASLALWQSMVPAGTPLAASMNNLTDLGWQLEDNLLQGPWATKNFFDDFKFVVPAPGASAVLGLLAVGVTRRRRR
jgi:hypothetical protein